MIGFDTGGSVIGGPGHLEGAMDWGLGPEGSEGGRVGDSGRRAGEDRDFGDDVSLQRKAAFMATAPVSNVTNYLEDVVSPREAFKTSAYAGPPRVTLRQAFDPSAGVAGGPETQPFSPVNVMGERIVGKTRSTGKPVPTGGTSYVSLNEMTRNVLKNASENLSPKAFDLMVAGLKMGLDKNQIAAIISSRNPSYAGSYDPLRDLTRINPESADMTGTPFHELAGHRLLSRIQHPEFKSFLNQQLPDVQALYETGGSKLSPGYGSQGEMVTSRAGTMRDLLNLNAPIHEQSSPYYMGMNWENFAKHMGEKKEADWNLFNPNKNLTDMEQLG